jgi:hypothetical protein
LGEQVAASLKAGVARAGGSLVLDTKPDAS